MIAPQASITPLSYLPLGVGTLLVAVVIVALLVAAQIFTPTTMVTEAATIILADVLLLLLVFLDTNLLPLYRVNYASKLFTQLSPAINYTAKGFALMRTLFRLLPRSRVPNCHIPTGTLTLELPSHDW